MLVERLGGLDGLDGLDGLLTWPLRFLHFSISPFLHSSTSPLLHSLFPPLLHFFISSSFLLHFFFISSTLTRQCTDIVRGWRQANSAYGGGPHQQQQVSGDLPPNMSLLPLYVMAMIKSPALRGGNTVRSDTK
jgi:hypothetical protein